MIRLMVVDDAPFIREIVRSVVERSEIVLVAEAVDGREAVETALKYNPDVILMDIIMPGRNGIEASIEILARLPEVSIVAFSTAGHESMILRALDAGCCSFLEKPFDRETLLEVIRASARKRAPESKTGNAG